MRQTGCLLRSDHSSQKRSISQSSIRITRSLLILVLNSSMSVTERRYARAPAGRSVRSFSSHIYKLDFSETSGVKNEREVQTVVRLVQKYYKNKEYCIITPYDAQRNSIAKALKAEGLPHDNVFNVDSFQGMCSNGQHSLAIILY